MELSAQEKSYIWLDSFPLTDSEKRKILERATSIVAVVKNFSLLQDLFEEFSKRDLFEKMQKTLLDGGKYFSLVLSGLEANETLPITRASALYPKEWLNETDAPFVLYAKGDSSLLSTEKFCIVGSRRTPASALKTGEKISKELSNKFTILTGVADGGDTAVIEGALAGTKKIICLLAGGFASLPQSSYSLMKKVWENGLLLTPNYFDAPVRKFSFERRNKLLALLSVGALIIGAGETSGALVTAKYANKYSKPVFALPYPPLSSAGSGCNGLIKKGARLTETASDILEYYGLENIEQPTIELTETERKAWEYLSQTGEAHLTEISQALGLPVFKASAVLSSLEAKGLAVKLGANRFSAV